jgi:laccase
MAGEWWEVNLEELDMDLRYFVNDHFFSASTINGKLGDLYNCSGNHNAGYMSMWKKLRIPFTRVFLPPS